MRHEDHDRAQYERKRTGADATYSPWTANATKHNPLPVLDFLVAVHGVCAL